MESNNYLSDLTIYRILHLIWEEKGISRLEIASKLALDKSTITKYVSELCKMGLVHKKEQGKTGPQGGRKPIFLEISPNYGVVGGIDITPERFICCILNLHGTILFQHQELITPEVFKKQNPKGIFTIAYNLIVAESKRLSFPLLGIGVGFPGPIDSETGIIKESVPLCVSNSYNFIQDIQDITTVPVCIENDARCCCYSERLVADISPKNMLFLLLEYRILEPFLEASSKIAIGMGLVLNGQIFRGSESTAGEFRSLLWDETVEGQLKSSFSAHLHRYDDMSENEGYKELSKHVAFLVNILNLNRVYIAGLDTLSADKLSKCIYKEINYLWPYEAKRNVDIQIASLGNMAVAYGAACMYLEKIFPNPKPTGSNKDNTNSLELLTRFKNNKIE
jgi:predicted NBD/HSP70 family sugar kinase